MADWRHKRHLLFAACVVAAFVESAHAAESARFNLIVAGHSSRWAGSYVAQCELDVQGDVDCHGTKTDVVNAGGRCAVTSFARGLTFRRVGPSTWTMYLRSSPESGLGSDLWSLEKTGEFGWTLSYQCIVESKTSKHLTASELRKSNESCSAAHQVWTTEATSAVVPMRCETLWVGQPGAEPK